MQEVRIYLDEVDYERIEKLAESEGVSLSSRLTNLIRLGIKVATGGGTSERDTSGMTNAEITVERLHGPGTRNVYPGPKAHLERREDGTWVAVSPDLAERVIKMLT